MANAIWQATITDQSGNILPGAEVEVINETTGLSAPLFSTRTGTAKSNPFFADANGFAQFYAAPGLYRITATSGGTGTTQTWRYVRLVDVATTAEAIAGTAGVLPDAAGVKAAINESINDLGTAATRDVGTASGNVMQVGAFGLGNIGSTGSLASIQTSNFWISTNLSSDWWSGISLVTGSFSNLVPMINFRPSTGDARLALYNKNTSSIIVRGELLNTGNTTVDPNGFIKAASPVASLYSDRAESNGAAELEAMQFERIGTGHYRLTGVPELSRDGWYIETPKDRNGNVYFTLDYVESDGVLDIYTFTPDYSTGRVENGDPVDILDGRFVSLRFAEAEKTEPEETTE